jgi:DNA-binding beta-propeller fold protein YncE
MVTEVLHLNTATGASLVLGSSGVPGYNTVRHIGDFQASRCALMEREGEILILSNLDGDFTISVVDPLTEELTLFTGPLETGLPTADTALQDADVVEITVPSARAPEPVFLVADDFNNDILVADMEFNVIQTMNLALSPVSVDAAFTPDGVLYVLAVDDAGNGWLSWGSLSGALTTPLQLGATGLQRAALWIDEGTGNILQVVATLDDATTTEDRIVLGAAYLDSPS